MADEADWWLEHDLAEVTDRRLRDAPMHCIRELAPRQAEQVLVHQDLHGENVLAAARELDRDRALGWTIAQTMAWSEGNMTSLDTVRWLLEDA